MIVQNVPEIDASAIEQRVYGEIERLTKIGKFEEIERHLLSPDARRTHARLAEDVVFVRDLLGEMKQRLAIAEERGSRRAAIPPRLRWLGVAGPIILSMFNYVFKTQREIDREQNAMFRIVIYALETILELHEAAEISARTRA